MAGERNDSLASPEWPEIVQRMRERTPARLLAGRSGAGYRTGTQMELRQAHAQARDAVRREFDLERDLGAELVREYKLFEVRSQAANKQEYLLRPDLGRHFDREAGERISAQCSRDNDLQIVIGDGLSVTAVAAQAPPLLPLVCEGAVKRGWRLGETFVVRYCRVGILNQIGELLTPRVAVLLIGERPGLATAESLSAYLAYRPANTHTDADRNLISNIHARGVSTRPAAERILSLAARMMSAHTSGYQLREELPRFLEESTRAPS